MSALPPRLRFYRLVLAEPLLCAPFIILYLAFIIIITNISPEDPNQYPLPLMQSVLATCGIFVLSILPAVFRMLYLIKVFNQGQVVQGYVMDVQLNNYPKRAPRAEIAYMSDGQEIRHNVALISLKDARELSRNGDVSILLKQGNPRKAYLMLTYTGVRVESL